MIHFVYRSYGGENAKGRPPYYSKNLALASFVTAATAVEGEIVFLNDGPVAAEKRALMQRVGEVVDLPGGPVGMRASYTAALRLAAERRWPDTDLVYFCEDDYLHLPDAFVALAAAAEAIRQASYFALYGSTPRHANPLEFPGGYRMPSTWPAQPEVTVGGNTWVNAMSTASTFGARIGPFREDSGIFRQCMYPFRNRFLDHETCVVYQGQLPYRGKEVISGLHDYPATGWGRLRRYGLTPFRLGLNARALSRRRQPHWLYTADPNLACHLADGVMTPGRDWAAAAAEVQESASYARLICAA